VAAASALSVITALGIAEDANQLFSSVEGFINGGEDAGCESRHGTNYE
jgi:hypothetical protein